MLKQFIQLSVFIAAWFCVAAFTQHTGKTTMENNIAELDTMPRITGVGGIFFKSANPKELGEWYSKNLGITINKGAYTFVWGDSTSNNGKGHTVLGIFNAKTQYFKEKPYMFNFRVKNLDKLLEKLKANGVAVDPKTETEDYGKFGWIYDADSNRIELWEPYDDKVVTEW